MRRHLDEALRCSGYARQRGACLTVLPLAVPSVPSGLVSGQIAFLATRAAMLRAAGFLTAANLAFSDV
jgi:hypothetical protein